MTKQQTPDWRANLGRWYAKQQGWTGDKGGWIHRQPGSPIKGYRNVYYRYYALIFTGILGEVSNEQTDGLYTTEFHWTHSTISWRQHLLRRADLWDGNTYAQRDWNDLPAHIRRDLDLAQRGKL